MAKAANGTLPSMPEKQPRFMDRFSKATKVGFVLLGYFLGIIGVLIDWAIGHKKKMWNVAPRQFGTVLSAGAQA